MKKTFLKLLIIFSIISCSTEDISEGSSNVLGDANTVVSFSPLGEWSKFPMMTDSKGYLYTFMSGKVYTYQANETDPFRVRYDALVKTNNKGELIWKINIPEMSQQFITVLMDADDNIYIPTTNSFSNEEVWFKISSDGVTEIVSPKKEENPVKELTLPKNFVALNKTVVYDENNNSYTHGVTENGEASILKKDAEGNTVGNFKIPLLNGIGHAIKDLLYYNNAVYVAMENTIEVTDDRLTIYTDGFRNIFLQEPYIAKFNANTGERIWFQKLVSNYVQIENEFIGDIYTKVLKPSIYIDNLTNDDLGNIWFNFSAYVKQDIGNTIGIETTFGAITTTLNAKNGGGTYTNLVQIQP